MKAAVPMVRLVEVRRDYGRTTALRETSLEVQAGEFVTLLGPSGSGKTTLLNIVSGVVPPSRGTVWINGKDVTSIAPSKRGVGMVFQSYALMPHMTVFQNIAFPLQIRGLKRDEIKEKVHHVLDMVHLRHLADRMPRQLSGGEQQRVSLARCIVYNPPLILMDEPLGALDKQLREHMQKEIVRIHKELGITIIYVTHDQDEALSMSDRIVLMRQSRVIETADPHSLYNRPKTLFAAEFLGEANILELDVQADGMGRLANGMAIRLPAGSRNGGCKLMIRPERLKVRHECIDLPGGNCLPGMLRNSSVVGGVVKHTVSIGDVVVTAQEVAGVNPPRSHTAASVFVSWDPADTHILEE